MVLGGLLLNIGPIGIVILVAFGLLQLWARTTGRWR
jgi:hypothetical protein